VVRRKKTRGTATDNIVDMSGIFKPHEECSQPRTVLIEGKPGMGKTTYCKKLVYDWATGKQQEKDCFPSFEIVLLLKCRDMHSDLWEAIDDQLLPREVGQDVRDRFFTFIRQNQSDVLLVLDGLDEVPTSKLQVFTEIIQGRVLQNCHLVATARHEAGIKVRIHSDTLLEIEGFTEEDARRFIFKYFKTSENLAQKLLSKLESDENLQDMAANPLNAALLCLVCEEYRGVFPERRTQLYVEMIQCILRRYRRKKGLPEVNEDLIDVYYPQLKHLGEIALNGLLKGKLDFEESELQNHADDLSGFGLLSVQTGGSKLRSSRHYSFLHKSFQEWFAGLYLYCQLIEKEISPAQIVAEKRFARELKEVPPYTCGLLAARCHEEAVFLTKYIMGEVNKGVKKYSCDGTCEDVSNETDDSDGDDTDDWLTVVLECVGECKQDNSSFQVDLCSELGSSLELQMLPYRNGRINAVNVVVLADVLKSNTTLTTLDLPNNLLGAAGATGLAEALKSNTTLSALDLSINRIGDAGAVGLAEALKSNQTLTVLKLSSNDIGDAGAAGLAQALKSNTTLTVLELSSNDIGAAGAVGLAEALKSNTTLTELKLSSNGIGDAGAAGLTEALKSNTTLTELDLSCIEIGAAGAASLAEALKSNTTLTVLNLYRNGIDDTGAAGLAEALKYNTTLAMLKLSGNYIGAAGAEGLAEALKSNTTLTVLKLSNNDIGAAGAAGLAEALKSNTTLAVLNLHNNDIGDAGAAGLAEALKSNTTLSVLELSYNRIGDAGAAGLAEALKSNTKLAVLNLHNNHIGDAGAAGFAEALKSNTTLIDLILFYNDIGYSGATSLVEALKPNTTLRKNLFAPKLYELQSI